MTPDSPAPPPAKVDIPLLLRFGIASSRLTGHETVGLQVALLVLLLAGLISAADVGAFAGIDLRNRVVGARLALAGADPYFTRWSPGMPEELLDPINREPRPRLTAPPTILCLYAPFAPLPYRAQRFLFWALEWAALLGSLVLLTRVVSSRRLRVTLLLVAVLGFAAAEPWLMHIERGQIYVLYLLLLSAAVSLCLRHGLDSWQAGVIFGLAAALRPSFVLVVPAFLVLGKWRSASAAVTAAGVAVALTLPLVGPAGWESYFRTGDIYYEYEWAPERWPDPPDRATLPWEAEGYNFQRARPGGPSSSFAHGYAVAQAEHGWPRLNLGLVSKAAMLLFLLGFLAALHRCRNLPRSPRLTLAVIVLLLLDAEYFLPMRWPYVDILYLVPLALLLPALVGNAPHHRYAAVLVAFGLTVGQNVILFGQLETPSVIRTLALSVGLTVLGVYLWLRGMPQPEASSQASAIT